MRKGQNFYRRDPSKALSGMIGLSLEERGVYNTVLDLLYSTWRPIEDDRPFISNWCGCAVQKLNPIIRRLIDKGRLITFEEGGRTYLSDEAFEAERASVKGAASSRSGRALVEEKSGEVQEKSAGVGENAGLLDSQTQENQSDARLEKNREEKKHPPTPQGGKRRKPETPLPDGCPSAELIHAMQTEARSEGANIDLSREAKVFRDWWTSKDGRHRDWAAAWRTWARKAIAKAPRTAVAAVAARSGPTDPNARWTSAVREFRSNGYWPRDDLGPPPGREGCRCPPDVLAAHGIAQPKPVANDLFPQEQAV
jgi:uncharacterized protein YdaU (DUF1376 family)